MKRCYFDGDECTCNAFDVAGDCPRDTLCHDDELFDEDTIEEIYTTTSNGADHDDETNRF